MSKVKGAMRTWSNDRYSNSDTTKHDYDDKEGDENPFPVLLLLLFLDQFLMT